MVNHPHDAALEPPANSPKSDDHSSDLPPPIVPSPPSEIGGRAGPDPTRYGDWELKGRCIDF